MAYAEFYMTLARIVLTYDMSLHNTTDADIEIHHASIVGYPRKSSDPEFGQVIAKVIGRRALPRAAWYISVDIHTKVCMLLDCLVSELYIDFTYMGGRQVSKDDLSTTLFQDWDSFMPHDQS